MRLGSDQMTKMALEKVMPTKKIPAGNALADAIDLARQGRKSEARWLLQEACRTDPSNAKAWLWRASVAEGVPEAINCLDRVLALEPENSTARGWLDRLRPTVVEVETYHCFLCAYEGAEEFTQCPKCRSILSLDLEAIFRNQGVDGRQVQRAIEHFKALKDTADPFDIEYFLGMAHLNLQDSDAALRHFRRAAQIDERGAQLSDTIAALSKRPLIMTVDDCLTIRAMVARTLERNGYRCLQVGGSVEALTRIEDEKPEFILLDVTMPFMDGYTLCKAIKGRPSTKRTSVVMLSGQDGFLDKVKGRLAGASDYLTKPFEPAVLLRVVRKYVH
jgi:twitching motility two-component system response regulator PilG